MSNPRRPIPHEYENDVKDVSDSIKEIDEKCKKIIKKYKKIYGRQIDFNEVMLDELAHASKASLYAIGIILDKISHLRETVTEYKKSTAKKRGFIAWLNHSAEQLEKLCTELNEHDPWQVLSSIDALCKNSDLYSTIAIYIKQADPNESINVMLNLQHIKEIIDLMNKHHLINAKNLALITKLIKNSSLLNVHTIDQFQQIKSALVALSGVNLLVDSNFTQIATGEYIDKSCSARINAPYLFFGRASKDEYENKIMWSYYCNGIESNVSKLINEKKSMLEIFEYVRDARRRIAVVRNESADFGVMRDGVASGDKYNKTGKATIANSRIFPAISAAVAPLINNDSARQIIESNLNNEKYTHEIYSKLNAKTSDGRELKLPAENIYIFVEKINDKLCINSVATTFEAPDPPHFTEFLQDADHFLDKIHNGDYDFHHDDNEKFLTDLGKFTFNLARFYPLKRGSGAVVQCMIRGIVKAYSNGLVDLGDIRLGESKKKDKNVPYDIYAHLIQNPEDYAKAFKDALKPEFDQARALRPAVATKI